MLLSGALLREQYLHSCGSEATYALSDRAVN
jgi:hypothetical protein